MTEMNARMPQPPKPDRKSIKKRITVREQAHILEIFERQKNRGKKTRPQILEDLSSKYGKSTRQIERYIKQAAERQIMTQFRLRSNDDKLLEELYGKVFVGREREFNWLDRFITDNVKGYALVTAPAGAGKTQFMANWLKRKLINRSIHLCYHFFSHMRGTDTLPDFLNCIDEQLIHFLGIPGHTDDFTDERLKVILRDGLERQHKGKLILLVDAIDEASRASNLNNSQVAVPSGIFPPLSKLSDHTFIIFSTRPLATKDTREYYQKNARTRLITITYHSRLIQRKYR